MIETYAPVIPIPHDDELNLRISSADDGPMLYDFACQNYDHLQKFQPQVAAAHDSIAAAAQAAQESVDAIEMGMYLQYRIMKGEDMTGTVTLFDRAQATAKLGYYVGKNVIGQGIAPRASRALIQYAAQPDVWGLKQIDLQIADSNVPSQHVAERLGAQPSSYFGSEPTGEDNMWRALRIWRLVV